MIKLLSMFAGPSGKVSSMRVGMIAINLAVVGTWCWVSIAKMELQPWSPEMIALVLGGQAIKAAQRKLEQPNQAKEEV